MNLKHSPTTQTFSSVLETQLETVLIASCVSVTFENGFDQRSRNVTKFYNRLVR